MVKSILIVKTSALGDILQSFCLLPVLKKRHPEVQIHWAVKKGLSEVVRAHPLIDHTIEVDLSNLSYLYKEVRKRSYDLLLDLQGNCRSGFITFLAKAKIKIGFGRKTVREWPNLLTTNAKINPDPSLPMQRQYLSLIQEPMAPIEPAFLKTSTLLDLTGGDRSYFWMMVCVGARWENKRLKMESLKALLQKQQEKTPTFFFFVGGSEKERAEAELLAQSFSQSRLVPPLQIPQLQQWMCQMDLVFAFDSALLHLAALAGVATTSIFGPTSKKIFLPVGKKHQGEQRPCPYGQTFVKVCPYLRTCKSGGCMKGLDLIRRS